MIKCFFRYETRISFSITLGALAWVFLCRGREYVSRPLSGLRARGRKRHHFRLVWCRESVTRATTLTRRIQFYASANRLIRGIPPTQIPAHEIDTVGGHFAQRRMWKAHPIIPLWTALNDIHNNFLYFPLFWLQWHCEYCTLLAQFWCRYLGISTRVRTGTPAQYYL